MVFLASFGTPRLKRKLTPTRIMGRPELICLQRMVNPLLNLEKWEEVS